MQTKLLCCYKASGYTTVSGKGKGAGFHGWTELLMQDVLKYIYFNTK